jgi:predicted Zn-dependent peptidase
MDVQKRELPNGLVVLSEAMPHLRSVSIGVWIEGGARQEKDGAIGIAHFIEHLLFKGTSSRTAADIAREIDSVGGQLNAFTDKEYVGFYAKVVDDHADLAFELLADIVRNPTFPPVEMRRERNVIFEEINMIEDSPAELVQEIFLERLWEGHPLGKPITGTKESVARITRAGVDRFFRECYTASSTVIAAAGNVAHRRVQELARRYFSDLGKGSPPAAGAPPEVRGSREFRRKENLEQMHVCLGTIAPSLTEEDRYAAHLLSTVLGGGMSSRLFQNVREKLGLVYSIYTNLILFRDAGSLVVYAGMEPRNAARVVELVCKELRSIKDRLVPAEELRRAKDNLKGSLLLSLESSTSRMTDLAQHEIYYGRIYTVDEILESIERVRSTDVRRVANRIFDAAFMTLTSVGSGGRRALESVPLRV